MKITFHTNWKAITLIPTVHIDYDQYVTIYPVWLWWFWEIELI